VQAIHQTVASIGVIGAGIFGVTTAAELADSGFAVTLYEKREDILTGTTARNFFRVHRGYHYPRDLSTARDARDGYASFSQIFSDALTAPIPHHYAIAAAGSRTTVEHFEQHCHQLGLRARRVRLPNLVPGSVEACFEVDEAYYDAAWLRKLAWERLLSVGVHVELQSARSPRDIARAHDFVVVAAYGSLNEILVALECGPLELQYELCEVPVVYTPELRRCSVVVLDGPFVSVAPYGDAYHVLYDVVNSVHTRFVGHASPGPQGFARQLDGPLIATSAATRFSSIHASARRFFKPLENAVHVGSLFAERVIIPGLEGTDARPTLVQWVTPQVISVLSGKVSTSIDAGRTVARSIASRLGYEPAGPRSSPILTVDETIVRFSQVNEM
jgi:hypothetical protein